MWGLAANGCFGTPYLNPEEIIDNKLFLNCKDFISFITGFVEVEMVSRRFCKRKDTCNPFDRGKQERM